MNSIMGFDESEVRTMLEYYREQTGVFRHSVDELLDVMKPCYNNYCFSLYAIDNDRVFNSDMVLYFVRQYVSSNGHIPEKLIDPNVSTDFFKMEKMIKIEKTFGEKSEMIQNIINDGETFFVLNPEFSLAELSKPANLKSLLFYMGLLSYGLDKKGNPKFFIPNDTVRQQYCKYLEKCYSETLGWRSDMDVLDKHWNTLCFEGDCKPFISYIASIMENNSSVRDFDTKGEFFVKGFILSHFCKNSGFTVATEQEANHGFADMFLEPLGFKQHAYLIELKYCKKNSTDDAVEKLRQDAHAQLQRYLADHRTREKCESHQWELHCTVAVFRGWKLEVIE